MTPPPVLALAFRVFFLVGSAHSAMAMAVWLATLHGGSKLALAGLAPVNWHAHEMVYGFSRAVVAGFLLTAVRNWTRQPTPTGWPLGVLALLWLVPRLLITLGGAEVRLVAGAFDVAFGVAVAGAVVRPVVAARQTRQVGIVAKLVILAVGEALFYGGVLGVVPDGVRWGIGTGVYMILALVLTIARRVTVFFVRGAFPEVSEPSDRPSLDRLALVAFFVLYVVDVFLDAPRVEAFVAGLLAMVHATRLATWWTPKVLGRPLLWVLFAAYGWFVLGFALQAAAPWLGLAPAVPLHAFTAGGVGAITLGMMARVSLGHTGRDVRAPSRGLGLLFALGLGAGLTRVFIPWLAPLYVQAGLDAAAIMWIGAFGALLLWGLPLWLRARPDGQPG